MVDEYMVLEARAYGADSVLLIVAILEVNMYPNFESGVVLLVVCHCRVRCNEYILFRYIVRMVPAPRRFRLPGGAAGTAN